MSVAIPTAKPAIIYPESDGRPMADNTLQFRWITVVQGNLAALFADRPDVFVAGDLLWYPVEGRPDIRRAPDVMVAIGRPKGDRGAYLQWEEGGTAAAGGVRDMVAGQHRGRNGAQARVL
jgi:Uma2 family endonuclease